MNFAAYDLHMHSTASDGVLSPSALMERAHASGVRCVALTDHDTVEGLAEAQQSLQHLPGLACIHGVEISVSWSGSIIHIVGLHIDSTHPGLCSTLDRVRQQRAQRGQQIAHKIESCTGAEKVWETVCGYASQEQAVARTHFARYLVEHQWVKNMSEAFDQYLKEGKKAYVPMHCMSLSEAVHLIQAAGGWAVIAHPGRYQSLSMIQLDALFEQFKQLGGTAIEVYTGSHAVHQYRAFEKVAQQYDFHISLGSDFHAPGEGRLEIGQLPQPATFLKGVWTLWE